jgi:uncharacterized membrane protein HdeD (DUF308 family)
MAIAQALLEDLSNNWWVILLRGIVGVIFGVVAFVSRGATLLALVFVWGAYAVIDGAFALYMTYLAARQERRWWPYLLEGLAGIGAGIVAFAWPGMTALALLYLIAAWAILTGIVEIIAAVDLRKQIQNEWLLGLGGVLSIVFGILVAVQPDAGALVVVWTIALYALLFGITLIVLAFRVRGLGKSLGTKTAA